MCRSCREREEEDSEAHLIHVVFGIVFGLIAFAILAWIVRALWLW